MSKMILLTRWMILCLLLIVPAAAQENANPLLDMLRLVPDTAETRDGSPLISYADYRAIEAARGIETPPAKADFDNQTAAARLWMAAVNGLVSGMPLNYFFQYLEGMEEVVGFSWFDVDRVLTFGQPPRMGNILAGDFDAAAIASAFESRDFTSENQDSVTIWCGPDGCDSGLAANIASRNPANPFGGQLGRQEPIAVLPGYIANSADYSVLTAMVDAYQGEQSTLAGDPGIQTAAAMIARKGSLRQAQFFDGADIGLTSDPAEAVLSDADRSSLLPVYSLAFFADTYEGDEQIALIGLVYDDAEVAKAAATQLAENFQAAQSLRAKASFVEMIEERGGQIAGSYAEKDAETGKFAAVLEIRYPMPSNEEDTGKSSPGYAESGLVFRLLINAVYSRDVNWLRTG